MIDIKIINKSNNPLPFYATEGAAGIDLMANLPADLSNASKAAYELQQSLKGHNFEVVAKYNDGDPEDVIIVIGANGRVLIPTGLYIQVPTGYKANVLPRSGMALNLGVTVANSPGLIDEDYRGEIGVILINHSSENINVKNGDRIAQLVITEYVKVNLVLVAELDSTVRGEGGFGSTNKQYYEL